jgi:preprotein translocase subunit SecA
LIGTSTVEKSEFLADLFKISNLPYQILNAKPENVARESEIIAQAGKRNAITIATNMAGRGTDIILGGNPKFTIKQQIEDYILNPENKIENKEIEKYIKQIFEEYNQKEDGKENSFLFLKKDIETLPFSLENCLPSLKIFYDFLYQKIYPLWEKENKIIKDLGGLFVLGTERHETRRIDDQLRGRSGRQGDEGISQFFVSLEDDLLKVFGGESIQRWVEYLLDEKDMPLESNFLTKTLENAQQKVELYNYEVRKNVFQYDDILNNQRKEVFLARNEILSENIFYELILRSTESLIDEQIEKMQKKDHFQQMSEMEKTIDSYSLHSKQIDDNLFEKTKLYDEAWISNDLKLAQANSYQPNLLVNKKLILLSIFDFYWTEHLDRMSYIRETINWRSYGQQNPLIEYNFEAAQSFQLMFDEIRSSMLYYTLKKIIH